MKDEKAKWYIYGFLGPDENRRVARFGWIFEEPKYVLIGAKEEAMRLRDEYPSIKEFYLMAASGMLARAFQDARRLNSMEGWVEFHDLCERYGVRIPMDQIN